jgi:hypothetical protein
VSTEGGYSASWRCMNCSHHPADAASEPTIIIVRSSGASTVEIVKLQWELGSYVR